MGADQYRYGWKVVSIYIQIEQKITPFFKAMVNKQIAILISFNPLKNFNKQFFSYRCKGIIFELYSKTVETEALITKMMNYTLIFFKTLIWH